MKDRMYFEIPVNEFFFEVLAGLVEVIPDDWSMVDGELYAQIKYITCKIAENTGYILQRFHNMNPTVVGACEKGVGRRGFPDYYGLMVEGKAPEFVIFSEAGHGERHFMTFKVAKRVAIGFLRKGYCGNIFFYKHEEDDVFKELANFRINPGPLLECQISNWQSALPLVMVELGWPHDNDTDSPPDSVKPIIEICREFRLKECTPGAKQQKLPLDK